MESTNFPDTASRVAYPLPKFTMDELYEPTMVTIKVNDSESEDNHYYERVFTVQRELISRHSDYFRGAFEGQFAEGLSKTTTITDFHPNTFQTFMDFVFNNEVSQNGDDPTEWGWEYLFSCYIFGDKYDSRGFRNRVFEVIQTKLLVRRPRTYHFPPGKDLTHLWENTSATDSLRKLLIDAYITEYDLLSDSEKQLRILESFPPDLVNQCLIAALRFSSRNECVHCRRGGDGLPCTSTTHTGLETTDLAKGRWCQHHQHNSDEEKQICLWRRDALHWKFVEPVEDEGSSHMS
ncbi:hypothetical protein M409DRAFT_60008 [Zasmidium cellare ATCC 36951]|uniref:BTB domain-containing protein n=1 Tax=Zasmidium cellare ATCC 36951 TaxID=1080233 RepID=A0A6A6C0A4_ZASCE|nr:uncharacterized protein M409DRAFT_60008 [Zasmidium cellare ATCC 36951]KAF2160303.1 hypothetical protein M409DRAFT_60008 [Zasmidium cellare ATCC 36951]